MKTILALLAFNSLADAQTSEFPPSLERAYKARAALLTARIDWSQRDELRPHIGLNEAAIFFNTTELTAAENKLVHHGDPNGVMLYGPDGAPSPFPPSSSLIDTEHCWSYAANTPIADVYFRDSRTGFAMEQLRSLGYTPNVPYQDLDHSIGREPGKNSPPRQFFEEREGELYVVTAKADHGAIRYWINPAQGWSITRSVMYDSTGKNVCECRSKLRESDGIWFPEEARYFKPEYKDGKEPFDVIKVEKAEFNRPEHPQKLDPEDIGIETGIVILEHDRNDMDTTRVMFWDGASLTTDEEFTVKRHSGVIQIGPNVERIRKESEERALKWKSSPESMRTQEQLDDDAVCFAQSNQSADGTPNLPDLRRPGALQEFVRNQTDTLWEAYTRRFIRRNKMDAEQVQKAWMICSECQSRASALLKKDEKHFTNLEEAYRSLQPGPTDHEKRLAVFAEAKKLLAPLNDIFEKDLKPRLDRLPTRAQRAAAEQSPASAPVKR